MKLGGRTLLGGTAYSIGKGKVLIGGTAYNVIFATPFQKLMADANLYLSAGRNSSPAGVVQITTTTALGVWYCFSFFNGYASIHKVQGYGKGTGAPSKTVLSQTSTSYGNIYCTAGGSYDRSYISYSHKGTEAGSVYGASLFLFTFPHYEEDEIDSILSSITLNRIAGRNASSGGTVSGSCSSTANILSCYDTSMSVTMPVTNHLAPVYTSYTGTSPNTSQIAYIDGNVGISTNFDEPWVFNATLRGGSILSFTES